MLNFHRKLPPKTILALYHFKEIFTIQKFIYITKFYKTKLKLGIILIATKKDIFLQKFIKIIAKDVLL